jgi:hypothetical protein
MSRDLLVRVRGAIADEEVFFNCCAEREIT